MVHIFLIQLLPQQLHGLTKALEMDDFPLTQEFDHIVHIRVVAEAQDVVIGDPGFLLCYVSLSTTSSYGRFGSNPQNHCSAMVLGFLSG